mmetsp:Transcript_13773/g.26723  ORF Transcript_13773/g.26723 Transcript_13773/m.26723 type:complete len:314 (-) Transcript_13773:122-1063(-)
MGDRKEINKYYNPDFDIRRLPRQKVDRDAATDIRLMLPFGLTCIECGNTMAKQLKVNATKETAKGMEYLGVRRFRFRFKCTRCKARITFLTDPQNADYELESGGKRGYDFTFERKKEEQAADKAKQEEAQEDETADSSMRKLEDRTLNSKVEMETMEALEDLQAQNRKRERLADSSKVILEDSGDKPTPEEVAAQEAEDAAAAAHAFASKRAKVRRLDEEEDDKSFSIEKIPSTNSIKLDHPSSNATVSPAIKHATGDSVLPLATTLEAPLVKIKARKRKGKKSKKSKKSTDKKLAVVIAYASSSDDDDDDSV